VYAYHEYRDLSKRKPYICAHCRMDITHPIHQPDLPGVERVREPEPPPVVYVDAWLEETEPDQYGHPPGHAMYGVDDRQAVLTF
jgi:hypothetical protein